MKISDAKDNRITVGEMAPCLKEQVPYMAWKLTGNEHNPVVTGNDADVIVVLKK